MKDSLLYGYGSLLVTLLAGCASAPPDDSSRAVATDQGARGQSLSVGPLCETNRDCGTNGTCDNGSCAYSGFPSPVPPLPPPVPIPLIDLANGVATLDEIPLSIANPLHYMCIACHSGEVAPVRGNFRMRYYTPGVGFAQAGATAAETWDRIIARIDADTMPPNWIRDNRFTVAERAAVLAWARARRATFGATTDADAE